MLIGHWHLRGFDPANVRSRAVAERLGERRIGEWTMRGRTVDVYAIDARAWRGLPP